ncbi:MAG: lamin tail domain-containing protein [Planctomycetes bacterium]|nr:lamin tail domain-containing protein [Planctomycetota bacterium]
MRRLPLLCCLLSAGLGISWLGFPGAALAQDHSALRINEVIASNETQGPGDVRGDFPDMIELFNGSAEKLELGNADPRLSLALSDTPDQPPEDLIYRFRSGVNIEAGGRLVVFCDAATDCQDACEPHANFDVNSDGMEPITLWGPAGAGGVRPILDQVWLPPLRTDVSLGRSPDGAGLAPVPIESVHDNFFFFPAGQTTFGTSCITLPTPCCDGYNMRFCRGGRNGEPGNLDPRVSRAAHSTTQPAAGEPVLFTVRVRDDKEPTPPNIAAVEIRYRVWQDGVPGEIQAVPMDYDQVTGLQYGYEVDPPSSFPPTTPPLDRWTIWTGEIPGQPAGSRVEFHFYVRDQEGLESTRPLDLCALGVGPCGRDFGGPGCEHDPESHDCRNPDYNPATDPPEAEYLFHGEKYIVCDAWFRYAVGYETRSELEGLVVNEVVPLQDGLLTDVTQDACDICPTNAPDCCPSEEPDCCKRNEDFIELYNASDREIDLGGLWLSDRHFDPNRWQFPEGARIGPREHLIVWCDNDGAKCPDPYRADIPCFWECPDPTDVAAGEYHTNFALAYEGEQIFIYDREEYGFGLIHGVEFGFTSEEILNRSYSLLPDGDSGGCYRVVDATPRAANVGEGCETEPEFLRGDSNSDCGVDLSDGVFILNYLFTGGRTPSCFDAADTDDGGSLEITDAVRIFGYLFLGGPPPADPGPDVAGKDPTDEDTLPVCVPPTCL